MTDTLMDDMAAIGRLHAAMAPGAPDDWHEEEVDLGDWGKGLALYAIHGVRHERPDPGAGCSGGTSATRAELVSVTVGGLVLRRTHVVAAMLPDEPTWRWQPEAARIAEAHGRVARMERLALVGWEDAQVDPREAQSAAMADDRHAEGWR